MSFVEQYSDLIISALTVLGGIVGILYVRAQVALARQNREIQDVKADSARELAQIKSDAASRDQQIGVIQQLAESNAKRELLYVQHSTQLQENWQKSFDNLAEKITGAIASVTDQQREDRRELLIDQKADRQQFNATIQQHSTAVKNIQDVLEVWVMRTTDLDAKVTKLVGKGEATLDRIEHLHLQANENSDHLLDTVEAIRDRIFAVQKSHNQTIQDKLDEVLKLLTEPKGEISYDTFS